jgi:hypothetical protein
MQFAIDLTPRQTARVLEQALRAGAELQIEPRNLPAGQVMRGKLLGRELDLLAVQLVEDGQRPPLHALIGAFCEVRTQLSGELYLFSSCVLDVVAHPTARRALITAPNTIQVANRRRFERTNAAVASQVRIWIGTQKVPAVGLLANVCADGLACSLADTTLDAALALGESVRVRFELAGFDEWFELPAVLCNKEVSRNQQQLSLGLGFNASPDDPAAQAALMRVRTALLQLMTDPLDKDGKS